MKAPFSSNMHSSIGCYIPLILECLRNVRIYEFFLLMHACIWISLQHLHENAKLKIND